MGGARSADRPSDPFDCLGEADRVEPDVRILALVDQIERPALTRVDRILERGLKATADVDDQFGLADRLDVAGRKLDVVGLDSRPSQVDDLALDSLATCSTAHARG